MLAPAFPALADLTAEGRARFLDEWEERLWAYWAEQLSVSIAGRSIDPRLELGDRWDGSDGDAAKEIADRLIAKFRSRPSLAKAPPWSDVDGWYRWLVGSRALRAARHREEGLASALRPGTAATADNGVALDGDAEAALETTRDDMLALVAEWSRILADIVATTGVPAIERAWLWATCAARRPLARYLGAIGARVIAATARWSEEARRVLVQMTETPGGSAADRTARTRSGAGACFRFNLNCCAGTRRGDELVDACEVFLGPAHDQAPYRPVNPVTPAALDGFRAVLRYSASAATAVPPEDAVAHLRAKVIGCALKSAVLRILPRQAELQLEREWDEIVSCGATA